MIEYNKLVLKSGINRMLEDKIKIISRFHLSVFGKGDDDTIAESISEWQDRNILIIIKPYCECASEDECIEVYQFIDMKSPIRGYLNWE